MTDVSARLFDEAMQLLNDNLDAWEGEENSVIREHDELIERTRQFVEMFGRK